jgi:hypothetical protein
MADTITDTSTALDGLTGDAGQVTGSESSLSNWAGDYVTDMLGRGWAMADEGYQAYEGPLTAGESTLQGQAFSGLANLTIPTGQQTTFDQQSFTDPGVAQQYMNPYVNAALQPQLDELRRQAQISRVNQAGQLTKAGAYGGSRQALADAELTRGMLANMAGVTGQGYRDAYNQAQQQFNAEQNLGLQGAQNAQQYGLAALAAQGAGGAQQRDIEQQGMTADLQQFNEERDFPYKQVQYMQSLLQGLPLAAQSYSYSQPSTLSNLLSSAGGVADLYDTIFGGTSDTSGGEA